MNTAAKKFLEQDYEDFIASLTEATDEIDPRQQKKVKHSAAVILLVALAGAFVKCQTWNEMADFGAEKIDFFRKYFPDLESMPTHDTLRRFFMIVSPESLENVYRRWARNMADMLLPEVSAPRHVAIDGKTIRGAIDPKKLKAERDDLTDCQLAAAKLHIVSAYLTDTGISLGQEKVDFKENEIVAIPNLIEELDIRKGDVITMDAMGTQKKIAIAIRKKKADYIFDVKDNQKHLREQIETAIATAGGMGAAFAKTATDKHTETAKSHSATKTTTCVVWKHPQLTGCAHLKEWEGAKTFGTITTKVKKKNGEEYEDVHYIISSLDPDAKNIMMYKRRHWGVENGLHWQLDVNFNEDSDRKRMTSAMNFSVINKIVIGVLNAEANTKKVSKNRRRMIAGWSESKLEEYLALTIKCLASKD